MRITILGSGTSTGVPMLGCRCEVCRSADPRDRRLRASAFIETGGKRLLIDCGPDFRQQALLYGLAKPDAVLFTHEHYDHVGGVDDLRPFRGSELYAEQRVADAIRRNLPYCFSDTPYPGAPLLTLHTIGEEPFIAAGVSVIPVRAYHAALPVLGFRIGNMAYLTDVSRIADSEIRKLEGIDLFIVDALRRTPHFSHFTLAEAQALADRTGARRVYFTHICHEMGLYAEVERDLPPHQHLCVDGLALEC